MNSTTQPIVHNEQIRERMKTLYTLQDIKELHLFLELQGTLSFAPLPTGLFPAAGIDPEQAARSGYGNVWVRDNIYVALAHDIAGMTAAAQRTVETLASFFLKQRDRFEAIIEGRADPSAPMNRPQVRFNGMTLGEIKTGWSHAQNDALGYFLWLYCLLAGRECFHPKGELLALFVLYFEAIHYWKDEDSGHWEERRKVEASSIGVVVAGLQSLRPLIAKGLTSCKFKNRTVGLTDIDRLIEAGHQALKDILPAECIQEEPHYRRYDAALLFLNYPLGVVDDVMGHRIVEDVINHLQGDYGIRRYLGDSYWTADYKEKVAAEDLTADVSERQEARDKLAKMGEEAQWCIFDPIVSVIFGERYFRTREINDLEKQTFYLNRSLGQITGPVLGAAPLRCPEAYYLNHGVYIPNDHVPLLWTQANLWLALLAMEKSASLSR